MLSALSRNGNGLIGFLGLRECKHATFDAPASEHLKDVRKPRAPNALKRRKGQEVEEKGGPARKH